MTRQDEGSGLFVPDDLVAHWQKLVNTMAELAGIPAGLIMRMAGEDIEVFLGSQSQGNPYRSGDREHLAGSGLYCERVINTRCPLLVPDALADPEWRNNPDVKLHMISYLGFPILLPDGTPFGTLCILDGKANAFSATIWSLLENFCDLIQGHLALLYVNATLGEKNRNLMDYLHELQSLRGLVPICARCKKIRNAEGHWNSVERYLVKHPEVNLTHSYCPDCAEKILAGFESHEEPA